MNPQFQKSKNARLASNEHFSKEIKKLRFLPSKMGGRLIHGIDLYTGKYGKSFHKMHQKMRFLQVTIATVIFSCEDIMFFMRKFTCNLIGVYIHCNK